MRARRQGTALAAVGLGLTLTLATGVGSGVQPAAAEGADIERDESAMTQANPPSGGAWADVGEATIQPTVTVQVEGGPECASNFVFADDEHVYLGMAARCAVTEEVASEFAVGDVDRPNACTVMDEQGGLLLDGAVVDVGGAANPGELVYSSWVEMYYLREAGESVSGRQCRDNDFALVQLDSADHDLVNPTVPVVGGPERLRTRSFLFVPWTRRDAATAGTDVAVPTPTFGPERLGRIDGQFAMGWRNYVRFDAADLLPGGGRGDGSNGGAPTTPRDVDDGGEPEVPLEPGDIDWGSPMVACSGRAAGLLTGFGVAGDGPKAVYTHLTSAVGAMQDARPDLEDVYLASGTEEYVASGCDGFGGVRERFGRE